MKRRAGVGIIQVIGGRRARVTFAVLLLAIPIRTLSGGNEAFINYQACQFLTAVGICWCMMTSRLHRGNSWAGKSKFSSFEESKVVVMNQYQSIVLFNYYGQSSNETRFCKALFLR